MMKNYNLWRPEVTVRLTAAAIIGLVALAFILAFIFAPQDRRPEIQFAAAVVGGAAAIYSAYHAGITLRLNLYRDRQKRSYEILDSFNKVDSASIRVLVDEALSHAASPAVAYRAVRADPNKDAGVRHLLGVFEDLAMAVRTGYADEKILFWSLQSAATRYYDAFKPYIDELRIERQSKKIFIELEQLIGAWRLGHSLVDGSALEDTLSDRGHR